MALAAVRDLRELAIEDETADFETDVLSGLMVARPSAGWSTRPCANGGSASGAASVSISGSTGVAWSTRLSVTAPGEWHRFELVNLYPVGACCGVVELSIVANRKAPGMRRSFTDEFLSCEVFHFLTEGQVLAED
ncbi:hypothetical protein [Nocardia sp. NPDC004711]